jgi:hypothetical protein
MNTSDRKGAIEETVLTRQSGHGTLASNPTRWDLFRSWGPSAGRRAGVAGQRELREKLAKDFQNGIDEYTYISCGNHATGDAETSAAYPAYSQVLSQLASENAQEDDRRARCAASIA